jgi:isopentenyl-diphosphate Delta-isomerase
MKQEFVILVDENDNETGTMEKMEAHRKAFLHRAVSVFIFNSKGEWLLQQRAFDKYHSGGLWTNACCSHPYPGETTMAAANRRLTEEMGMEAPLESLFRFQYQATLESGITEHEVDHVFIGISDREPVINRGEANDWRYVSTHQLSEEIKAAPENFTVWFKIIFEQVKGHMHNSLKQ